MMSMMHDGVEDDDDDDYADDDEFYLDVDECADLDGDDNDFDHYPSPTL
jgi:hypothetical protein